MNYSKIALSLISLIIGFKGVYAQKVYTLDQAIEMALTNNKSISYTKLAVEQSQSQKKAVLETPKTNVTMVYGQANSIEKHDNNFIVTQTFRFPTYYTSNQTLGNAYINQRKIQVRMSENELRYQVKELYYRLLFLHQTKGLYLKQDSIASSFLKYASLRKDQGEGTQLEKTNAQTRRFNIQNQLEQNKLDIQIQLMKLQALLGTEEPISIDTKELKELPWEGITDSIALKQNPMLAYYQNQIDVLAKERKVEVSNALPDFNIGYFNQSLAGVQSVNGVDMYFDLNKRFQGFQVGISIPLFYGNYHHKIESKAIGQKMAQTNYEFELLNFEINFRQALQELQKNKNNLTYYKEYAMPNANEILKSIEKGYSSGEIDYAEFLINLSQVITINKDHLEAILNYNLSVIYLDYLSGNN